MCPICFEPRLIPVNVAKAMDPPGQLTSAVGHGPDECQYVVWTNVDVSCLATDSRSRLRERLGIRPDTPARISEAPDRRGPYRRTFL